MHWLPHEEAQRVEDLLRRDVFEERPLLACEIAQDDMAVFDIQVEEDASFLADGFIVHNSDICRYLDGKRFSVAAAMDQFRRVERLRDPEAIKQAQPWLRVRQDAQGNRAIFVPTARGDVRAAIVEDSAERRGLKDERGTFRAGLDAARLETLNVGPPPYHGLCRSVALPEV